MGKVSRSKTSTQRLPLTRERVLQVALALADEGGLEAVSMRQVAQGLSVEAMSLYKHVANKDDLVDGLVELVVVQIDVPSITINWKQAVKERALSERKVLNRHPWAVTLFETTTGTGVTRLIHQNHMIGILRRAGFSIELSFNTMITLAAYVYGFVILEHAWSLHAKERPKNSIRPPKAMLSESEHPYVFEMVKFAMDKAARGAAHTGDFDFGLNLIVDGLEKKLKNGE